MNSTKEAYFLSHNGLGDNITSIGAVRFLLNYYDRIYFLCRDIHLKNNKLLYNNNKITVLPFDSRNEFNDCGKIIKSADEHADIFICGYHMSYLKSRITNPELINRNKNDKHYTIVYDFIRNFYYDIGLDLSIYCEYFLIESSDISKQLYGSVEQYNIIFLHTQSSSGTINVSNIVEKYISDEKNIIICANTNFYQDDNSKHHLSKMFVNIPVAHYIDILCRASAIYVVDSCFSTIILPLKMTNKLQANVVEIISR